MRLPEQEQFSVLLRHKGRSCLATTLLSFSTFGILTSLTLIVVGVVLHESVGPYRAILDKYDGAYLSFILGGLGIAGFIVYSVLIFLLLEFTNAERSGHFGGVCITLFLIAGFTLAAGVICFVHLREVDSSFRDGLKVGMNSYKNNSGQKSAIDEVQIRYKCCGLKGYQDWFNVSWVNETFVDKAKVEKNTKNGVYQADDVPFSCCDPSAFRPCIHEAVHTNSHHYNYDHLKNITLYKPGCLENLKKFFGPGLLFIMGSLVCSIAVVDFVVGFGTRILYTSLLSAKKRGDEFGPGYGIFWPGKIMAYESVTSFRK